MLLNIRDGKTRPLLDDPKGGVRDPQLHYTGEKILFSYRKGEQPYYHLYEINIDGTNLRQLTHGPYDDFEPTYLPDGGIAFCSSRCQRWVPCYYTQVAVIYRCDGDGNNIRQLSSNVEQENTPWVLPDGRILYQRWEYVDRSQIGYHHLWTMNPDGTGQMVYYGNLNPNTAMLDAKPIPNSRKVVASFSPGHGRVEHSGFVTIADPRNGPDDEQMAKRLHPNAGCRDPYPISENQFLVARNKQLLLMDDNGQLTLLYELSEKYSYGRMMLHEPRPVKPREKEQLIAPSTTGQGKTGFVLLADVYKGRNMTGVNPGEIKKLLVLEILPKPTNMFSGMEPLTYGGTFLLERILGTVDIEDDGSAYIELPAMRPLFFVALDENGNSVKRMQSFLTVQPGETVSCVGCHEHRTQTPPITGIRRKALNNRPQQIKPISNVPDLIDFPRDIQPILDHHCLSCHDYTPSPKGSGPMSGGIILSGDHGPMYSHSYYNLTIAAQFSDGRNLRKSNYPPRAIGSSASQIMQKLDGKHHGVSLSEEEKQLIRLWIDTGAVYAGTYAALGTGSIGDGNHLKGPKGRPLSRNDLQWESTKKIQKVITARCVSCHNKDLPNSASDNFAEPWNTERRFPWFERWNNALTTGKSQRKNPDFRYNRHLLYNLTRPEKSLLLLAPLAKSAGGYEICKSNETESTPVFNSIEDSVYQTILQYIDDAKDYLEKIKRFDMEGFKPRPEYLGQLIRYGLITEEQAKDPANCDPYKLERKYWKHINKRALSPQNTPKQ